MSKKTKTLKLAVGVKKDITVMVHDAPIYEDGKSLAVI